MGGTPDPFSAPGGSPAGFADQVPYYPVDCALTSMLQRIPGRKPGPVCGQNGIWGATATVVMAGNAHKRLSHIEPAGHTCPQVPQLFLSYCSKTQVPPQLVSSMSQHFPELHNSVALHTFPQEPQLFLSVFTQIQYPPQFISPGSQHRPKLQKDSGPQVSPQEPQLFLSLFRSAQVPEHDVLPPLHVPEDAVVVTATGANPVTSTNDPVVVTAAEEVLVTVVVIGTVADAPTHVLALQYCPLPHTFPHDPQLLESAAVLRQIPAQTVWPSAQLIPEPALSIVTRVVGT
jgi:hypothetical protein